MQQHGKSKARIKAVKALYTYEIAMRNNVVNDYLTTDKFANEYIKMTIANKEHADEIISSSLRKFKLEEINIVNLSILRMLITEYEVQKTPPGIIIKESHELVKQLSDPKDQKFIHSILSKVINE